MKKTLFTFLVFVSICVQAREIRNLKDLRIGDSFSIRITVPIEPARQLSVWEIEQSQKIDVGFQVLGITQDSVVLAIQPTRWFIYYQSPHDKRVSVYLDSDYVLYSDKKRFFYQFNDHSATASINTGSGKATLRLIPKPEEEKNASRSKKEWYTQPYEIPQGLGFFYFDSFFPDFSLNFEELIKASLESFIARWEDPAKPAAPVPWLVELNPERNKADAATFINILDASFPLQPNTFISLTHPGEIPEDRLFLKVGNRKIMPTKKEDNSYEFSFFLPLPKRAYIGDLILDLTPSDSLIIGYDKDTGFVFEGRGAANSAFTNTITKWYSANEDIQKADMENRLAEGEKVYQSTLDKNFPGMNSYWLKSAKLSNDYWHSSQQFKTYNKNIRENWSRKRPSDDIIPWNDDHIKSLFPSADYLYQPYMYADLVDNFFIYKAREANNSVMTGMNYLEGYISSYYFSDAVFWGYPRTHLTSKTLKELMVNSHLERSNREYEDFIGKQHDPETLEAVIALHRQLKMIEPGANIKELGLDVEKYIPLKKNPDKYIILLVGNDKIGFNPNSGDYETNIKEIQESLKNSLREDNLTDKVDLCLITSVSSKSKLEVTPEIEKGIIFAPDKEVRDYEDKVVGRKRSFIVLKSNGEIVNRYHPSEYKSSIHFLLILIKDDIENPKNQDSATGRILVILFTILISAIISFLAARYLIMRRERIKRRIQELELKAIRAQINPHFTFNALGSIQNLILQKKDREANEYLVNFAKLLRMVLSTSEKKLISLSDEIELLDLYLRLEQLRVNFTYAINVDQSIDTENEDIPGMLIQPIVENAVKHGIVPNGGGNIVINFKLGSNTTTLLVEVIDSGKGFPDEIDSLLQGFGLKSVRERLNLLSKELHLDIELKTGNIIEENKILGASVNLYIPV